MHTTFIWTMFGQIQLTDSLVLIAGTSAMLLMLITIISLAFLFQRKLIKKQKAYHDIQQLMKEQEISSAYRLIQNQEDERKRIAGDLHDNVGNLLASLKIYSDLIQNTDDRSKIIAFNEKIASITENVTTEIRRISHHLDSSIVLNFGFQVAVNQLAEALHDSGKIKFESAINISEPLTRQTSLHLYRIIQELMTNTLKHAKATKARLEVNQIQEDINLIFEDNGIGFKEEALMKPSIGLQNIRSRLKHLQGNMSLDSNRYGTTVIIDVKTGLS